MTPKPWYQSKVVWFNTLTFIVVIASFFGYTPNTEIVEIATNLLIALAPVINLILRGVTKQPIE